MAKQIGEDTKLTLDLKTIGFLIAGTVSLATMYYSLQSDIAMAMQMPEPVIDRVEYDLKDELIRETIMNTQEDVQEMKGKLDKIDERLYQLQNK
tara:strand:- start:326 stop:607 length:282 start_codon:yes stop_codon:yes gene_type:complete